MSTRPPSTAETANTAASSPVLYEDMTHAAASPTRDSVLMPTVQTAAPASPLPFTKTVQLHLQLASTKPTEGDPVNRIPLLASEESRRKNRTPLSMRHASLSCVHLSDDAITVATSRKVIATGSTIPLMQPPNESSEPEQSVDAMTNVAVSAMVPPPVSSSAFEVELHVYDLSSGVLSKHCEELTGVAVPAVYHSGIACYGLEFYFEGGIGVGASGRTRFGDRYHTVRLGATHVTLPTFLRWIEKIETSTHQLHDYHPVRHNCHHFTNLAAEYLLGRSRLVPEYVFSTLRDLTRTANGSAVRDILLLTTQGIQCDMARLFCSRIKERQRSMEMLLDSTIACSVLTLPPCAAVVFRVRNRSLCKRTLLSLRPFVLELTERGVAKKDAVAVLEAFTKEVISGFDTLHPNLATGYVDLVAESLLLAPLALWGPILNSLRVAVLHKVTLATCVFHPRLMSILKLACRDFPRLLPDGKLALLRVLCNFSASELGAIVHNDRRFLATWVSVAGLGLADRSGAVVYTASCLAANLALSVVITACPSLTREMVMNTEHHPLLRLATVLLYNVRFRTVEQLPEPSFNMVVLALLRIMSSNTEALQFVMSHSLKLRYKELLRRAQTNESRSMLCIAKTLEELYG